LSTEYRLFETDQFAKDLGALAKAGLSRFESKLRDEVYCQLRVQPYFGPNVKKLKDYRPETWRYRIGSWRFFYEIDDDDHVVIMVAASHRGSAY